MVVLDVPVAAARIGKCQVGAGFPWSSPLPPLTAPRTPYPGPGPTAMTNVYSLDGILVFGLLFVCTCAYFKKVPRLKTWLLSEKKGVWGVFYKAAVIGTRLHAAVAIACVVMAFYVLFIKWILKHPFHHPPAKGTKVKSLSGAWAQHRKAQLKSSKSPGWHHSICPYFLWGKLLMITNIIYASGATESKLPLTCV